MQKIRIANRQLEIYYCTSNCNPSKLKADHWPLLCHENPLCTGTNEHSQKWKKSNHFERYLITYFKQFGYSIFASNYNWFFPFQLSLETKMSALLRSNVMRIIFSKKKQNKCSALQNDPIKFRHFAENIFFAVTNS